MEMDNIVEDFKSYQTQADQSKPKDQLIAELADLRNEVLALNQKVLLSETLAQEKSQNEAKTRSQIETNSTEFFQSYTVVVVEDSELYREVYRRFLTRNPKKNCHVVEFSNAEDALVWCRDHTPDILLIDYGLPGMNGLDFLLELREQVGYEKTPCIIMTSEQDQALAIQSLKSGAKDFWDKAKITPEGFNRAITNVLQQSYWIKKQELQRERQQLVNMIAYSIRQSFELEGIFQFTVNEIRRLLQCDRVLIYQIQGEEGRGKILSESVLDPALSILEQEITDRCFEKTEKWVELYCQGQICAVGDIEADSLLSTCYREFLKNIRVRAKLIVPIVQDKHLWGLLVAHHCTAPKYWTTPEVELFNQLSVQIAIAIQTVELKQLAQKEYQERQKFEEIITYVASGLVAKVGEDFFQLLVSYLSQILEVDYVCLAELIAPETARTLAICHQRQIIDNFEMNVSYQPCSGILESDGKTVKIYQNHAKDLFPDHELIQLANIQACLGIPLLNSSQKVIGLLTILHRSPVENLSLAENCLKVFSHRAETELERQQIEAKLRRSEADLLEAQSLAHVGNWKWNKITNEVWWSEEVHRIFGISSNQKITFPFFIQQIYSSDRDRVLQEIEEALHGKYLRTVYRIHRPNKEIRFVKVVGKVIGDAASSLFGMRGTLLDITELKKAEIELQRTNIGLEEKVKIRTKELTNVYIRLQNELDERRQIEAEKQESENFYSTFLENELAEKKRIEAQLRESELRYRRIVETSSEGIWQLDKNNKTVFVNPRMAEMLGYSVEEILELSLLDFVEETEKGAVGYLLAQQENSLINQYDVQFCRRDGSVMWAIISARSVIDEAGQYLGRLKMVTDISDRKKIETDLRQSQLLLETLASRTPGTLYSLVEYPNHSISFDYLSSGCYELFGYDAKQMIDNPSLYLKAIHPDDRVPRLAQLTEALEKKEFFCEWRIISSSGQIKWVQSRSRLEQRLEQNIWHGVLLDITDRKQAEAKVKEFNRRWRSVLDNIQMMVVQLDQSGNVEYVNPFFEQVSQNTPEEVLGKNWFKNFIPSHLVPTMDSVFEEILKNEVHSHYENPILIKSGEERMITWRNSVLKDNLGQPIGVVAIGEDITERHHLERMKSEFISIAGHELKTPLTAIQASLSLLHEKIIDPSSKDGEESLGIAVDGVDRLVRLVNDILDLERLQSGGINAKKSYCNTQEIITEAIKEIRQLAKQADIQINVSPSSFQIYADYDRIIQVLINLISNAIKFSPKHSTIEVSTEYQTSESVNELTAQDSILFIVRDQGRGIPAQKLETIFERFQQVDASDSREKSGTGLGLAICRDIVEQHGGKIWVKSIVGQSSIFYFTIPTEPNPSLEALSNHE